jgi:hypothetical protein
MARLDRTDVLLLREFYVTGQPYPHDTMGHVLRLLVDRFQKKYRAGQEHLSYSAIRQRLENLKALGLIDKVAKTNPAIYVPLDYLAGQVRYLIFRFAGDLVGITPSVEVRL